MKTKFLFLPLGLLVFFYSCKTLRPISLGGNEADLKKIVIAGIDRNNLPENILITNMNFKYVGDKNISARITFYSQLNECLFASFRYLGFEAIRVGLYPDSIKFINRFQREYIFEDLLNIKGLPVEADLDILQPFLLSGFYYNNLIKKKEYLKNFSSNKEPIVIKENSTPGKEIRFFYNPHTAKLDSINISDLTEMFYIEAYLKYKNNRLDNIRGSILNRGIKGNFELDNIDIQNISYSNTQFNIGKNYKKIEKFF
jgi:Domain of unknown function (DUF4292)